MRLRIRWSHQPKPEPGIFSSGLPARRRGLLPWLGSLAAHGLAVVLVSAATNLASWVTYDRFDPAFIEPLRIRAAFYYVPDAPPVPKLERARPRPVAPTAPRPDAVVAPAPARPPKLVVRRQFELPPAPAPAPRSPVILQPDIRIKVLPQQIPALAFWARQIDIPRPDRKQFVVPGRVEPAAPPPRLTAPPVLKVSNKEVRLTDLNVAFSNAPLLPPALPVTPSATSPVRTDEVAGAAAAALDALAGQAGANLISLSPQLASAEQLTVPGGLVNAPRAEERSPVGSADRSGPGGPKAANGNGTGAANGSARDLATALPPIRIEHPANGKFDAVVMQSAARDDLAAAGGVLGGNPVYIVYLKVGDRKEWMLEFCAPAAPKPAASPYEVFVEAPVVLSPPYPLVTLVPGEVAKIPRPKHLVLHGFLTSAGAFRDMASDSKDPLARAVLPNLATWRFRPASKDRQPVEVEVLLVIPPES